MKERLSVLDIKKMVKSAEDTFRHEECKTCECYLGYLAQLEIDSDPNGQEYLLTRQPPRAEVHACLGCDPCPPGILYSNYLRKKTR